MKNCKGCRLYNYNLEQDYCICKCIVESYIPNKVGECPCSICLIKTMCMNGCDLLKTFRFRHGVSFHKLSAGIRNDRVIIATRNRNRKESK